MGQLERFGNAYLDITEFQTERKIPMIMEDWEARLNSFIKAADRDILCDTGKVTTEIARQYVETEFEEYCIVQNRLFISYFDRFVELEVTTKKHLEKKVGKRKEK